MTDPEKRAIPVDVAGLRGTLRCVALELLQANYFPHANAALASATALETLAAENARLREALDYYADNDHYDSGDVPGHIYVIDDHGRYARTALSSVTQVKESGR